MSYKENGKDGANCSDSSTSSSIPAAVSSSLTKSNIEWGGIYLAVLLREVKAGTWSQGRPTANKLTSRLKKHDRDHGRCCLLVGSQAHPEVDFLYSSGSPGWGMVLTTVYWVTLHPFKNNAITHRLIVPKEFLNWDFLPY